MVALNLVEHESFTYETKSKFSPTSNLWFVQEEEASNDSEGKITLY